MSDEDPAYAMAVALHNLCDCGDQHAYADCRQIDALADAIRGTGRVAWQMLMDEAHAHGLTMARVMELEHDAAEAMEMLLDFRIFTMMDKGVRVDPPVEQPTTLLERLRLALTTLAAEGDAVTDLSSRVRELGEECDRYRMSPTADGGFRFQWRDRAIAAEARVLTAEAETEGYKEACIYQAHELSQALGKALGYPPLFPYASEVDDGQVCVGDHVAESLADEAADIIVRQRAELSALRALGRKAKAAIRQQNLEAAYRLADFAYSADRYSAARHIRRLRTIVRELRAEVRMSHIYGDDATEKLRAVTPEQRDALQQMVDEAQDLGIYDDDTDPGGGEG